MVRSIGSIKEDAIEFYGKKLKRLYLDDENNDADDYDSEYLEDWLDEQDTLLGETISDYINDVLLEDKNIISISPIDSFDNESVISIIYG